MSEDPSQQARDDLRRAYGGLDGGELPSAFERMSRSLSPDNPAHGAEYVERIWEPTRINRRSLLVGNACPTGDLVDSDPPGDRQHSQEWWDETGPCAYCGLVDDLADDDLIERYGLGALCVGMGC